MSTCWCTDAFLYIGGALLAYKLALLTYSILSSVYAHFLRPSVNLKKYGAWAVVTGATDGIGRAFAFQLAKKGLNIVLISRTRAKLDETAAAIKQKFPVDVRVVEADFASQAPGLYESIADALKSIEVGVLVNNVGVSYDYPEYFAELPEDRMNDLVSLNIVSVNKMTRIVLPGMVERKKGAIINVSSGSGTLPCPLLTVYAASKAYVDSFSQALAAEYAGKGIFVQSLVPFFVVSKLSKFKKPTLTTPTAEAFAAEAVSTIGHDAWTGGYWAHNVQHYIVRALPTRLVTSNVFSLHKGLRARALKSRAAKAEKAE